MHVSAFPNGKRPIIKAKPYNSPAKIIEGAFARLEAILAGVPGWIRGDRMKRKAQSVGRPAASFPGTAHELRARIMEAIDIFNATPLDNARDKAIHGRSPDDLFRATVDAGCSNSTTC